MRDEDSGRAAPGQFFQRSDRCKNQREPRVTASLDHPDSGNAWIGPRAYRRGVLHVARVHSDNAARRIAV